MLTWTPWPTTPPLPGQISDEADHWARLDTARAVLILTRELVRPHLKTVTIAPITTTVRGLSTEVALGTADRGEQMCVVACDHITTIPVDTLAPRIGALLDSQEPLLSQAIHAAFDGDSYV